MKTCEDLKKQLAEARALANLPPVKPEEPFSVSSPEDHREKTVDEERSQNPESRASSSLIKQSADPAGRSFAQTTNTPCTTDRSSRSLSDDKRILTDPAVASSFVEVFVERLIDNFSPQPASVYGGTVALREASRMRILSPMLCTAFEAASLTFAGRREQIREVEAVGHARYVRVLRQLQTALNDPKQNKSTEVMVVVLLFTIIEVRGVSPCRIRFPLTSRAGLQAQHQRFPAEAPTRRTAIAPGADPVPTSVRDRSVAVRRSPLILGRVRSSAFFFFFFFQDTVLTGLGYRGARPEQTHVPREQGVADRPVAGRRSIQGHPPPTAGHRGRHPRVPRADRPLHRGPPQRHRALDRARRAADGPLGPRDGTAVPAEPVENHVRRYLSPRSSMGGARRGHRDQARVRPADDLPDIPVPGPGDDAPPPGPVTRLPGPALGNLHDLLLGAAPHPVDGRQRAGERPRPAGAIPVCVQHLPQHEVLRREHPGWFGLAHHVRAADSV